MKKRDLKLFAFSPSSFFFAFFQISSLFERISGCSMWARICNIVTLECVFQTQEDRQRDRHAMKVVPDAFKINSTSEDGDQLVMFVLR